MSEIDPQTPNNGGSNDNEQNESNRDSFDQKFEAKIANSGSCEATPDTNKSKRGKGNKNGYVAKTHENVHASGKKMRHEVEQKRTKHHKEKRHGKSSNRYDKDGKLKVVDAKPLKEQLGESFFNDSDSSEDEGLPDYKVGGYHPVHVGEVFKERYVTIQKLGWGHFSTVWLAKDRLHDTYVALKVQKSAQHYIEAAYDEVEILDQVSSFWRKKEWQESLKHYYKDEPKVLKKMMSSKYCHTVQLLNSFMHHGPNGKHYVMVFEILGVNLLEIIKRYDYRGVPLHLVRELTKQCLVGLDYLNRVCKLIHTDLKPENVVITLTNNELRTIRDKGVLKTTKMYNQDDEIIARQIAGANEDIILSQRETKDQQNDNHSKPTDMSRTEMTHSEMGMSKEWSEMNPKEKKKFRKKKRKQVKKYITQGRLPANYDDLPQEERDRMYQEIRHKVNHDNLVKDGLAPSKQATANDEDEKADIDISANDIGLGDSTTVTNDQTKQSEPETPKVEEQKMSPSKSKPKTKARQIRHASAPRHGFDEGEGEVENQEIEKLKQLMSSGMDDSLSKPDIPKLNTNALKPEHDQGQKVTKRGPKIDEDVNLAIVDMGNGCWTHHHFTSQIQTRQYRSPETIIGVPYGPSADIWSLACMTFELLTGDFLFEPRKGYYYDKDDDHLAQMVELLGPMPKNFALSGKNSRRFFDSTGHLRRIRGLNYWPLHRVLNEKYRFREEESKLLADFLLCMLTWYPDKRATAQEMLDHPWLKMARNDDYRMHDEEYEKMMTQIKTKEENEKKKRELEILLREGNMDPETLSKKIRSENMSELAESNFEKNAGDIEDFEYEDLGSEISPRDDDENSVSLGFDDPEADELF